MSDVKLARARVEPGKADRLRAWYEELQERESEVVETLRHEGVYTETAFVQSFDDGTYLYLYMEAADIQAALEAGAEKTRDIHEEHHAVLDDALAGDWQDLEPVGHFTNPTR